MADMTLEQAAALLDAWGNVPLGHVHIPSEYLRRVKAAIDAHLAGMGEPVATLHADGYWAWKGIPPLESNYAGWRLDVYTATPASIDIAAVRRVIDRLNLFPSEKDAVMGELTAALPEAKA